MNIDFIKWMCEKAGWVITGKKNYYQGIWISEKLDIRLNWITTDSEEVKKIYYPLLLQRAIEGVNRDNPEWLQISQCGYSIQILTDCNRDVVKHFDIIGTIDKTKESVLKYIYEQEKNK